MRRTLRAAAMIVCLTRALDARGVEICGNGIDDDANNLVDEKCLPSLTTGQCENPLSCSDTGAVSPGTGALHFDLPPDVAPTSPYGLPLAFRRFYQSQYAPPATNYRKALGERWGHSYASWLDKNTVPNPDQVVVHLPRGQDVLFEYTTTAGGWDEYKSIQPGIHFQYLRQRTISPNEYQLKTLTGEVLVYNSGGKLTEIWDSLATPNKVLLVYNSNGLLVRVTDATCPAHHGRERLTVT